MSEQTAADTIPGYADFLSKVAEALGDIPPPPIFASGELFPSDHAWSFTHERQQYVLGSPRFWEQLPAEGSRRPTGLWPTGLWGIPIVDVDARPMSAMADKIFDAIAAHLETKP